MRKFLLLAAAALMSVSAMAIDKVQKKATLKEITSVEELASATFKLTNHDGQVMYTPTGWDIKVIASAEFTGNAQGGFYKLEAYNGHWLIPVYENEDGTTRRTYWAGNQYVNSQPAGGNVIFGLAGTNDQHGQDGRDLAVWDITYSVGNGFAFHCVGRDIYLGYDASAARPVNNIVYWTATGKVTQYVEAEVVNAYNEVKSLNMQASVKTALEAAKDAYDAAPSFGKLTTYGDAVNAAIVSSEKYVSVGGDLTSILVNPHFNTNDLSAWNMNGKASPTVTPDPTHNCEFYEKDFNMSMTIKGMKKGTYEIGMQAFQRPAGANAAAAQAYENGTNTSIAQLYTTAMETEVPDIMAEKSETSIYGNGSGAWPNDSKFEYNGTTYYVPNSVDGAKAWFELGHYQTTAKAVVTEDGGDLTFGFKGSKVGGGWILFDNFTLTYISEDVLVDASESEKLIANIPNGKMNADVKAAMDAAVTALEADKTNGTLYNALKDAISNANTSIEKYAAAKAALDAQKALMDATNVYNAEGFATYKAAWTENCNKYENGTLTNEDGIVNPTAATGWHASTAYNFLLTPWTIGDQAANNFEKALYINTWSTEGNGDGTHFSTPFFEYWTGDAESLADNTISTTITGLETGIYEVSVWVRARAKNGVDATDATGIKLSANGASIDVTEGSKVGQFNIKEYTVEGFVTDGTLTIALDVEDANVSWLSFKNVKYTKVDSEYFYLRNVEADKYVSWGAIWGTHTVVADHGAPIKVSLGDGGYTLAMACGNDYTYGISTENGWPDFSLDTWTLEDAGSGQYRLKGKNGYFRYNGTNSLVVDGSAEDSGILWEFVTKDELTDKMATATADAPVNATHFINSPDFLSKENGLLDGSAWGVEIPVWEGQPHISGDASSNSCMSNSFNCEIYNTTNSDIKQTLTGLPKGTYKLSCYGFYRDGSIANAVSQRENDSETLRAVVYAGDVQLPLMSIFEHAGATGLSLLGQKTTFGEIPNSNYDAAYYFEAGHYLNSLYFQIAEDGGSVTIGIKKDEMVADDWAVFDNFDLMYFGDCTLAEAESADVESLWSGYKATYDAKADLLNAAGKTSYSAAVVATPTTAAQLTAAKTSLNAAYVAAVKSQGDEADFTSLILNPNFENSDPYMGWANGIAGGDDKELAYQLNSSIQKEGNCYLEMWQPNGEFEVKQRITNLPAGLYKLTVYGRTRGTNSAKIYINDVETNLDIDDSEKDYEVLAVLSEISDITIGAKTVGDGTSNSWFAVDNFRLTYVCADPTSANMAVNATAKYGTFCAPFAVTIPSGVTAYTVESAGDNGVLNMNEVETTIPANTPVILNAESGLASTTVYGKAIAGTPTNGVLTGVYTKTAAPVGSYILQNNDNKVGFYKVAAEGLFVGANRCYLNMPNSSVKAFFFAQDDEDGINAIEALTSGKAEIYNLNGQKLNRLQKGINIVNGQKIMVK